MTKNNYHIMKIKFVIWNENKETINTLVAIQRLDNNQYAFLDSDGENFISNASFDPKTRKFYAD